MLSAAQMAQMNQLLKEGLELDPSERRRWLEAKAPQHPDLVTALKRALLPQEEGTSAAGRPGTLPGVSTTTRSRLIGHGLCRGQAIGPYRLIRPLGAGGMGEVWLAERSDGAFKREVALKLPTAAAHRPDLARRLAHERDILAALEHPNIARLYDAGISAEGLPYLAMEYVRGEPLTAWCDARSLDINQRLKFFLQVLDAVQYAHRRQVMHRDIKPWNILVSDFGQVRLLDFGVAELLGGPEGHGELTQRFGRALTPEYASPELARGYAIDAATDVYSLGVVLYELLCGNRPYRLEAGTSMTALESIATARVEPPSTQLAVGAGADRSMTQARLARRLRGDLDAIVLKALAKAPEHRYGSPAAFGDDLRRYLGGKPVVARPDRLGYRLSRLLLRHRVAASVAAASVLLVVALSYALLRGEASTARQTKMASTAASPDAAGAAPATVAPSDNSVVVLPFVDLSEHRDQEYFADGMSEELIDRLSHSPALKVISRTSSFYFKGRQTTVGEIARTVHVSYVLEGSVRKDGNALRIVVQLIRASDGAHVWSQTYDRALRDAFELQEEIAGTVATALKVALGQEVRNAHLPASTEAYNQILQGNYFLSHHTEADVKKAITYYQDAIRLDPNYALAWAKLASAHLVLAANGWMPGAEAAERARGELQNALGIDPDLAYAHRKLGELNSFFDHDFQKARAQYEQARKLDPGDPKILSSLAVLEASRFGRLDESIQLLRQALVHDPLDTSSLSALGWILFCAGRLVESEAANRRLLELNPSYTSARAYLALTLLARAQNREALDEAQKESDVGFRLFALPIVYQAIGRKDESDQTLHQLSEKYAAVSAYNIAEVHAYRGEVDAAFEWLERAYRQRDSGIQYLNIDPLLRKLHGDPRLQALLIRTKLVD